jgi:hypothetical protein
MKRLLLAALTLTMLVPMASPAGAYGSGQRTDSDNACGSVLGLLSANCGSVSITASTGSCTSQNLGYTNETLACTAGDYTISGSISGWLTPGTVRLSAGSGCTNSVYVEADIPAYTPLRSFGPYTVTCPGFTVQYGYCRQAAAGVSMTFDADFAPRSLYAVASINQTSDGCVPNHP